MAHSTKRYKSHHYGEIYLSDSARALLGDQYINNVYNLVSDVNDPQRKQREILSALAYMDMNLRRNQLEAKKIQHVEWIWGATLESESSLSIDAEVECYEQQRNYRQHFAEAWGFDADDDDVWSTISCEIDRTLLEEMATTSKPGFVQWLQTDEPIFWINGKPASGKSSLMTYLSNHEKTRMLLEKRKNRPWHLLYFFFDFRAEASVANSLEGMFRSLLFQLVDQIPHVAAHIASDPSTANLDIRHNLLSVREMAQLMQSCISSVDTRMCIFVDGLDEYRGSYTDLVDTLVLLADGTRVKLCLASRPEPEIVHTLQKFPNLKMQNYNHDTIANYAEATFDRTRHADINAQAKWTLVSRIVAESRGVILWCNLVCTEVKQGLFSQDSIEELLDKIDEYPRDLDQVYLRLLSDVEHTYLGEALIIFHLIETYSNDSWLGSIELYELRRACEIVRDCGFLPAYPKKSLKQETFVARLLGRFGGLIDIFQYAPGQASSCDYVRLTHKTLASFLQSTNYMNHPVLTNFRARFPNHVRLRLLCEEILSPKQMLLIKQLGISVPDGSEQTFPSKPEADLPASSQTLQDRQRRESVIDHLSQQHRDEYDTVTTVIANMLSRAEAVLDVYGDEAFLENPDLYQLVRAALLAPPLRLHSMRSARWCCCIPDEFFSRAPSSDYAFYVCLCHSLWNFADDLYRRSTQSRNLRAECSYGLARIEKLPRTLQQLDEWIEKLSESVDLTRLLSQLLKLSFTDHLELFVQRFTAFCMLTSPRDACKLPASKLHGFYCPPSYPVSPIITSFPDFWMSAFQEPYPMWCESFGISRVFLLAMYSILSYPYRSPTVLEWLDLILGSGDSLNTFCYPNGSILHLVVESFPLRKDFTLELVKGLIERNIDITIEGAHGTPLDIVKQFPNGRNRIFQLRPEYDKRFGLRYSYAPYDPDLIRYDDEEREVARAIQSLLEQAVAKSENGQQISYKPPPAEFWLTKSVKNYYDENGRTLFKQIYA